MTFKLTIAAPGSLGFQITEDYTFSCYQSIKNDSILLDFAYHLDQDKILGKKFQADYEGLQGGKSII